MKSKKEKRRDKEIRKDFYSKRRNYHRNLSKIEVNRLKYDKIMSDIYGVSLVATRDVIMENAGGPSHVWDHYLAEKKDEFLLERAALLYNTMVVNEVLNNITDGEAVDMIIECYIDGNKKHDDVAYSHDRSEPIICSGVSRVVLSQLKK